MSEKCELCGGKIERDINEGGDWSRCTRDTDECLFIDWWETKYVDRIQLALRNLKQIEARMHVLITVDELIGLVEKSTANK